MKGSDSDLGKRDCSKPADPTPRLTDEDLAERYSLGHPDSERVRQNPPVRFDRRERRPYFVR